jgi:hypothetical protein
MAAIPEIIVNVMAAEIAKLELNPGDTIILKVAGKLSYEMIERLKNQIESFSPGHKALVLDQGLDLSVVAPAQGG